MNLKRRMKAIPGIFTMILMMKGGIAFSSSSSACMFMPPVDSNNIVLKDTLHFADSLEDTDSEEIDDLIASNWIVNQIFAYRDVKEIPLNICIQLVDSLHSFILPVEGKVWNGFGPRGTRIHKGVDIGLNHGDPVKTAFDGVVRHAARNRHGYGNIVVIRHFNGLETYYAHLSRINVKPGDQVKAGDIIGLGGSTGRSRGSHLHFEVRYFDKAFDPEKIICFETGELKASSIYLDDEFLTTRTRLTAKSRPQVESVGSEEIFHTVKKGDTLSKIAQKYGITIAAICRLNNIRPKNIIKPGQVLRVN